MISLTLDQLSSISGTVLTLCRTWDLILRDGAALYLTDHDKELVIGAKTYHPANSLAVSAMTKVGGMKDRDREVKGALDVDLITEEDMLAGRYRDAMVKEAVVDWENLLRGQFLREVYWIKTTTTDGRMWVGNVTPVVSFAQLPVGRNYSRDCNHMLGGPVCGKNLSAWIKSGTVSTLTIDGYSGQFTSTISTELNTHVYYNGKLTFTSGQNSGREYAIKTLSVPTGAIVLWLEPIFPVEVGDGFSISPGCDKKFSTCKNVFANAVNHGGFPFLIGNDRLIKTPDSKE